MCEACTNEAARTKESGGPVFETRCISYALDAGKHGERDGSLTSITSRMLSSSTKAAKTQTAY